MAEASRQQEMERLLRREQQAIQRAEEAQVRLVLLEQESKAKLLEAADPSCRCHSKTQ